MTTPEEFAEKMQAIIDECEERPELAHEDMDDLMAEMLIDLGYGKGAAIFTCASKWYD